MRIVIVGAGALGSLFGGLLAQSGQKVFLYNPSNTAHIAAIRADGLHIETPEGILQIAVSATDRLDEIEQPVDLLGIFVKAYDTDKALEGVRGLINKETWALSVQNGIGSEAIISRYVPETRLLRGTTAQGATLVRPGLIRWAGRGQTRLGMLQHLKKPSTRAQEVLAALNHAGIETEWVESVEPILWEKLLINAAINPLTALFDCPNGRLIEDQTLRALLRDIVAEALPLVQPHGVKLSLDEAIARVESVCRATAENISSMLQDIRRKKRTEIDFINGTLVREGERLKQPIPLNRLLTALVQRLSP
jgi:2-dehydropantoate 2-reductase